jgi:hypothetical protein
MGIGVGGNILAFTHKHTRVMPSQSSPKQLIKSYIGVHRNSAGTLIFARSGSGRNWLKKHGRNRNSVIFRELEYRIYLLNKIDQTD